jgi:hypothetical protein
MSMQNLGSVLIKAEQAYKYIEYLTSNKFAKEKLMLVCVYIENHMQ